MLGRFDRDVITVLSLDAFREEYGITSFTYIDDLKEATVHNSDKLIQDYFAGLELVKAENS